jgi:2-polyprenyl-3-methyl-5-hydroxy-6-metoxy-1,4-benzoquinol methylase
MTRLYTDYYPRSSYVLEQYRPHKELKGFAAWLAGEYSSAFRWVPEGVRILDIGCGFGETLGYHKARGCDVYGVEADENIRRVAEKFGFNVHVGLFDPMIYEPGFFDYVTLDQVVEHVNDPLETLRGVRQVLAPEGRVIISTPNAEGWGARVFGRRWINWHAPYHRQFFSVPSMRTAAEEAGLVLEEVKTVTNSAWLHFQWLHLMLYPKMGEPSLLWSPRAKRGVGVKSLTKMMELLHATKLNHLITRFFDSCGWGDNRLFFLRKP